MVMSSAYVVTWMSRGGVGRFVFFHIISSSIPSQLLMAQRGCVVSPHSIMAQHGLRS